jgi:hypothetical protein
MEEPRSVEAKSLDSPDAVWRFLDESERVAVQLRKVAIGAASTDLVGAGRSMFSPYRVTSLKNTSAM